MKFQTCYKNPENPSCIDLIITNSSLSFQNTKVLNIGCSDFHKMSVTVLKNKFPKLPRKDVTYRNYKNLEDKIFKQDLASAMGKCNKTYPEFDAIFVNVLEKHAPIKRSLLEVTMHHI